MGMLLRRHFAENASVQPSPEYKKAEEAFKAMKAAEETVKIEKAEEKKEAPKVGRRRKDQ